MALLLWAARYSSFVSSGCRQPFRWALPPLWVLLLLLAVVDERIPSSTSCCCCCCCCTHAAGWATKLLAMADAAFAGDDLVKAKELVEDMERLVVSRACACVCFLRRACRSLFPCFWWIDSACARTPKLHHLRY
ncbi:unnamed protein product [Ectocarpus sp. 4 AP-2014]